MIKIKFTKFGACTAFGEFGPGTIVRLSPALARHFVDELKAAEYLTEPKPAVEAPPEAPAPRKGKRK